MSSKTTLAVLVVTHNEAERIVDFLLRARRYADEIVLVDQYSTDATTTLAAPLVDTLVFDTHTGMCESSRAKAEAVSRADWLLHLDADEELAPDVADALPFLLRLPYDGYSLARQTVIDGHDLLGDKLHYRLFRRGAARYYAELHTDPFPGTSNVLALRAPCIVHEKSSAEQALDDARYDALKRKNKHS